jgi:hypothetical protein
MQEYPGFKRYGYEVKCVDPNGTFFDDSITRTFKVDITPPEITLPALPSYVNVSNVTFNFETENESQVIRIYVDKVLQQEFHRGSFGYDFTLGDVNTSLYLKDGENNVMVEVLDKADNKNSASFKVIFNNTGPFVTRLIPDKGIFRGASAFKDQVIAYLGRNILDIDYENSSVIMWNITGDPQNLTKNHDNYSLIYSVNNGLRNGEYSILVTTYDINGTPGEMMYKRFIIDENATQIKIFDNASDESFKLDQIIMNREFHNLSFKFTTYLDEDIDRNIFYLNNQSFNLSAVKKTNISIRFLEGLNQYHIYTNTTEGNKGESYTYFTWLDTSAPEPEICFDLESCGELLWNLIRGSGIG